MAMSERHENINELDRPVVHDNMNCQCEECKEGRYIEVSLYSDWEGWLQCSHCSHRVDRYV